jgi:hypothetical protein
VFLIFLKINKNANETKDNDTENNCCLDELVKNIKTGEESINNFIKKIILEDK